MDRRMGKLHYFLTRRWVQVVFCPLLASTLLFRPAAALAEGPLPEIEVRALTLSVEKKSTSGRVILFSTTDPAPELQQLIMIKSESGPRMALRVIQRYDDPSRFAAQSVRSYDPDFLPAVGESHRAILKIRDIQSEAEPGAAPGDEQPAAAPESQLEPQTESAPQGAGPTPAEIKSAQDLTEAEERELKSLAYEEPPNHEPEKLAFGGHFALLRLPRFDSGALYASAAGLRYSQTVRHPLYFPGRKLQDSVSIDFSLLASKILDYSDVAGDSYTLIPMMLSGRYNWLFSENLGAFGYAGLVKPWVLSYSGDEPSASVAAEVLGSIQLAFGVGIFYQVGPQWFIRLDLGIEQVGAGLSLKF